MVFVTGKIPSFEMDDDSRGTLMSGNLHLVDRNGDDTNIGFLVSWMYGI